MPANVESMFYVGDMPWHKEGIKLEAPPDSRTAIIKAGLNWTVSKVNLYCKYQLVNDYYGIMRNDNKKILGVVGKGYVPLQNEEAFQFFDPLIESGFLEYETAGSLGSGEIIWVLAKLKSNSTFAVYGDDIVHKYLLLSNSHDGQSSLSIKFTPIRVVCQNTLNIALSEGETTRIKHLANMKTKLEGVQLAVDNISKIYDDIELNFKEMAKKKLGNADVKKYFNNIYPVIDKKYIKNESQMITKNINSHIQARLTEIYENGLGVEELGIGGTLWAAYNAVTQYIDHPVNYKLGDNKLLKRMWFGDGENLKKKAYNLALKYIKAA